MLALALGMLSLGVLFLRQNMGRGGQGAAGATPAVGPAIETTAGSLFGGGKSADVGAARAAASAAPVGLTDLVVPASVAVAAEIGTCLTWTAAETDWVMAREVACAAPHRGEVTKVIDLSDRFPTWPREEALDALLATKCAQALPGRRDVTSSTIAPWPGAVHVSHAAWEGDAQVLICIVGDRGGAEWSGSLLRVDVPA